MKMSDIFKNFKLKSDQKLCIFIFDSSSDYSYEEFTGDELDKYSFCTDGKKFQFYRKVFELEVFNCRFDNDTLYVKLLMNTA